MSLEPSACEDLKAFERRLTEVIAALQPSTLRWRILLGSMSLITFVGAFYWLTDPRTSIVPLVDSLWNHPVFTFSTAILLLLFVFGIHKLVIAPQIITSRTRSVLAEFNMSCDETGKLILRPRPTNNRYTNGNGSVGGGGGSSINGNNSGSRSPKKTKR